MEYIRSAPRVAIGLDFAFSLPMWYLSELGINSGPELWAHVAQHGEEWLCSCKRPWWGRKGRPRPLLEEHYRRTERELRKNGVWPKSVFQIGGAGAVGTGSIRGMPLLHRLRLAGASIWPFDKPGWPLVLEIYPRLLTGSVVKSSAAARAAYVQRCFPSLSEWHVPSDDAFDAAVSALLMARHAAELEALPATADAVEQAEGRIWQPHRAD